MTIDSAQLPAVSLEGKRVLITGASSGIGRACAIAASALGAECVLVARRVEALEETRSMMACPEIHRCVPTDLADLSQVETMMKAAVEGAGPLDGIVHCAIVTEYAPIRSFLRESLSQTFRPGLFSFLMMARYFSRKRYGNSGGSLVAISSSAAMRCYPIGYLYCSCKAALNASIRALALELAPKRIRVNTVMPHWVRTRMASDTQEGGVLEKARRDIAAMPFGIIEPQSVANMVCFLLSDAAQFTTGAAIPVDGGVMAR